MTKGRGVLVRRTWPQRLVVLASLGVIVAALISVRTIQVVEEVFEEVNRVRIVDTGQYGRALLRPDTPPGAPVNFLLVGTDSALGLDPDDPVMHNRVIDPTGRSLADTIMLLRLDPVSGSAWVLSIPRDLWAEIPGAQDNRITSALYIGGAELLVATVTSMFDVEINHYMELDLAGFREVVDVLGGVPVWFPNPTRDPGSGLDVATPGCHVLDGERALQYVRSRRFTEQIDGRWQITGGDDFTRIERQQDFLVLALDRAIDRGARNFSTMGDLVRAGAAGMTLDHELRPAELIELGRAFADFNPENLQRHRLAVYTLWHPDGSYQGEAAYRDSNRPLLDVFRGVADSLRPSEVSLRITGADDADRNDASMLLSTEGFDVMAASAAAEIPATVVLHAPGGRAAALTVARYLDPVPHVVERAELSDVVVALGADYGGINLTFQRSLADVEAAVDSRGAPPVLPETPPAPAPPSESADGSLQQPALQPDQPHASAAPSDDGLVAAGRGPASPEALLTVAAVAYTPDSGSAETEQPAQGAATIFGRPPPGEVCG